MYMIHGEQDFINWSVMTKWDRTPHFHLNGPSESVRVETKSFEGRPSRAGTATLLQLGKLLNQQDPWFPCRYKGDSNVYLAGTL